MILSGPSCPAFWYKKRENQRSTDYESDCPALCDKNYFYFRLRLLLLNPVNAVFNTAQYFLRFSVIFSNASKYSLS
jgi:hypothetical protein